MKKGVIFTLDVAMGTILAIIVLVVSMMLFYSPTDSFQNSLQMARTASDVVKVMVEDGTIQSLDSNQISNKLAKLVPVNYGMRIVVEGTFNDTITAQTGLVTSEAGKYILAGRYYFAVNSSDGLNYGRVNYEVWQK